MPANRQYTSAVRRYRDFVSKPKGWGTHWFEAVKEADTRLVSMCVLGDSISVGETAGNWLTQGYVNLLRQTLQQRYGDGGSGFVSLSYRGTANPGGGQVVATGAWTEDGAEGGITRVAVRPTVAGNGAIMSFPVRGSIVDIWLKTYNGTPVLSPTEVAYGTFDYRIDGGSWVPVNLNQATGILKVTVSGLSAGAHTVDVRATTGTGKLFGVSGRYTTGLVVSNMSYSSTGYLQLATQTKGMTATDPAENTMGWRSVMAQAPHDLVLMNLGGDIGLDVDDATFSSNLWDSMNVAYNAIQKAGPSGVQPDVAVVLGNTQEIDVLTGFTQYERDFLQYRATQKQFAETIGGAVVDVWGSAGRSPKQWIDLGYWGGAASGAAGADRVHPSNAGHQEIANLVYEAIRP